MKAASLFNDFFNSEKAGGLILVFVTIISLAISNSPWSHAYVGFWEIQFAGHDLVHWINDGLMTIFFLLIGLELEREIYDGELSNIKNASLPIVGALGGMVAPAGIYLLFNFGTKAQSGAGIPMATDIAFAVGILSLLGKRVPASLKIFLTALAVIDDLGAIIVIAVFYTSSIAFTNLFISLGIMAFLFVLNRLKVYNMIPYLIGGVGMWYFMLQSGVHATITGVLFAFVMPFGSGKENSPSYLMQHFLHRPVAFIILPLFAMANTCIALGSNWTAGLGETESLGIIAGLVIGKPLGISLFCFAAVAIGICSLPGDLKWKQLIGASCLGGIGFTMSIFIALLAFSDPVFITNAKIAILTASLTAGIIGYVVVNATLKAQSPVPKTR